VSHGLVMRLTGGTARWTALLLLILPVTASAELNDPTEPPSAPTVARKLPPLLELTGRVVDEADLISPEMESRLTRQQEKLEDDVGPQFVIVTVNSLQGQSVEEYTLRLGNCWGIGSAEHSDGLILLVAPNEGKARIEVGLGLEDILTDAYAAKVMSKDIVPYLAKGEMEKGISRGAETLMDKLISSQSRLYARPPRDFQGNVTCNG
jgi:uncharacterized protein